MRYRGYIDNFSFSETASEPGICTYNFNFNVLYSSGVRKNYMPWHIESEVNGTSRVASIPILGTENDEYTYNYNPDSQSQFIQTQLETDLTDVQNNFDLEFAYTTKS